MADVPEKVVADKLATALSLVVGTTIFKGQPKPPSSTIPHKAIFCMPRAGRAPVPYLGGSSAKDQKYPRVQVFVRGDVDEEEGALTLARSCLEALHKAALPGYVGCVAQQSEPTPAGFDDTNHPLFSVNVELWLVD